MNKSINFLYLCCCFGVNNFFLLSSSFCVENIETIKWSRIQEFTIQNNERYRSKNYSISAKTAAKYSAYGDFLPDVNLVAGKSDSNTTVKGLTSEKSAEEYGAEASWVIFNGFATSSEVAKGAAEVVTAEANKKITSAEIRYQLRSIYFQYLVAVENLDLLKKIRHRQKNNINFIRLKYRSGSEALWSLNKAEGDLLELEQQLEKENFELEKLRRQLFAITGIDNSTGMNIIDSTNDFLGEISNKKSIEWHPERIAQDSKIEAARQVVRKARSEYFPMIAAEYSYKKVKNDATPERVNVSTIGIKVKLPLFDGLSTNRNVERALAEKSALELERAYSIRNLEIKLTESISDYAIKLKAIPVARLQYKVAKDRVATISEQYKIGLKKFLDWEQAEQKLIEAEKEEIRVKKEVLLARAELEWAYGLELGED